MNDWLPHAWAIWLLIAVIFAILEVTLPYFTFIFCSLAALVAAGVAFFAGGTAQICAFSVAMVLSMLLVRPRLLERFHRQVHMPSRAQILTGEKGQVIEALDPISGLGRVVVNGQDWAAKSDRAIALGKAVEVVDHDGITLIIREI